MAAGSAFEEVADEGGFVECIWGCLVYISDAVAVVFILICLMASYYRILVSVLPVSLSHPT